MEVPSFIAIVWMIVSALSKRGSYLRISSRRMPWYDSHSKRLTLAYVLAVDPQGARIIGNHIRDSSDSVDGMRNGQILSICFN